jgi:hypothetical protein
MPDPTPITWTDVTSRSKGESSDAHPRTIEAKHGPVCVTVTRHIHYPGSWTLLCAGLIPDRIDLDTDDLDQAKARALNIVCPAIIELFAAFDAALDAAFRAIVTLSIKDDMAKVN